MSDNIRNFVNTLNISAPLNMFLDVKQTPKDKLLPIDLSVPIDFVCLRRVSSFRPFYD